MALCENRCIDVTSDSRNCGSCGNDCGTGKICGGSQCRCPTGQTDCDGQCADLNFSAAHCGRCDAPCLQGQTCDGGSCTGEPSGSGGGPPGVIDIGSDCQNQEVNENPLGCELAWGANGNGGTRTQYLDFITTWVGDEPNGGLNGSCGDCSLVRSVAGTNARVGYYAYFIGFQANLQGGFGDCNTDNDNQTLCTRGAQWVRDNRTSIIQMYANYARMTYEASPNQGVLWLLEGDFIQYTTETQQNPLSYAEAGQLTADIICAIKANEPNAAVAMNHSAWNSNEETDEFWRAMPLSIMDFVWTTGAGNANGFITSGTTASSYNGETAKYSYLHSLTGKRVLVDTSFGASQQADSWSDQNASTLNQRIADGIFAVNVTSPPPDSTYSGRISALGALASTCD
jgi:hypothetical protein